MSQKLFFNSSFEVTNLTDKWNETYGYKLKNLKNGNIKSEGLVKCNPGTTRWKTNNNAVRSWYYWRLSKRE